MKVSTKIGHYFGTHLNMVLNSSFIPILHKFCQYFPDNGPILQPRIHSAEVGGGGGGGGGGGL